MVGVKTDSVLPVLTRKVGSTRMDTEPRVAASLRSGWWTSLRWKVRSSQTEGSVSMGGREAVPERLSMFTRGRIVVAASALGALSVVGAAVGALPAGAASTSSVPSPVNKLLSASAAKALGYPKVAEKPQSTSKTQQAGCPKAAQVAYEDSAGQTAVIPEILACTTTNNAAAALAKARKSVTPTTAQTPPKALGTSAFEVSTGPSTFAIAWQRGKYLAIIQYDVNVPATSSSSTTTSPTPTPITAAQQKALSNASLAQDKTLK